MDWTDSSAGRAAHPPAGNGSDRAAGEAVEVMLEFDPPGLGPVRLFVRAEGERVEARLLVRDDSALQLVQSHLPALRQRLADAGIALCRLDVGRDSDGGPEQRNRESSLAAADMQPRSRRREAREAVPRPASAGHIDVLV